MVWRRIKEACNFAQKWWEFALIVPTCTGAAIAIGFTGIYQPVEFLLYDSYLSWRSEPPPEEDRILVVGIAESDIQTLGEWPISDRVLATALMQLAAREPRSIGLDLYRDLHVGAGYEELDRILRDERVKIFGVEKGIGKAVGPPPTLEELGREEPRVGLADTSLDIDGRVRRSIISVVHDDGNMQFSLSALLALNYLERETLAGEPIRPIPQRENSVKLGRTILSPLLPYAGAYVRADTGGYQVLLNYHSSKQNFDTVTLAEVLAGDLPAERVRDKIVLIGSVAESINDLFQTPFTRGQHADATFVPGVFIHAHATNQLISGALDGRPPLRTIPEVLEWAFAFFWGSIGLLLSRSLPATRRTISISVVRATAVALLAIGTIFWVGYSAFLLTVWIPIMPALIAATATFVSSVIHQNQILKIQANYDQLTKVANRHQLELYLDRHLNRTGAAAFILCDVDFFKKFNDTYGHQMGDACLKGVAKAIAQSIRRRDLVSRYGGEEFIVVLPETNADMAWEVAERIRHSVKSLQLDVSDGPAPIVSISCGVAATAEIENTSPEQLIARADKALYQAKQDGRDRSVRFSP